MAERKPGEYGYEDTSFRAMGGEAGIRTLVDHFYDLMDTLPEAARIRAMHKQDLSEARDKLAAFLCGWLGGPKRYSERWGPIRIPKAHAHLGIVEQDADAWMLCMTQAAAKVDITDDFRAYFLREIRVPANRIVQAGRG
ncbi:MAG: group II truncated hemoglobin [Myxococcales bacterium]|nr:group II truncated hemoglobin [Myxococcales bacterium]